MTVEIAPALVRGWKAIARAIGCAPVQAPGRLARARVPVLHMGGQVYARRRTLAARFPEAAEQLAPGGGVGVADQLRGHADIAAYLDCPTRSVPRLIREDVVRVDRPGRRAAINRAAIDARLDEIEAAAIARLPAPPPPEPVAALVRGWGGIGRLLGVSASCACRKLPREGVPTIHLGGKVYARLSTLAVRYPTLVPTPQPQPGAAAVLRGAAAIGRYLCVGEAAAARMASAGIIPTYRDRGVICASCADLDRLLVRIEAGDVPGAGKRATRS